MTQETIHQPLPMADEVVAAAVHGSFCPKMCNHVCPVFTVTGRDDAMPWSLHREVADLGLGRTVPSDVGGRLDACNGCLACQNPCVFDQDVPAQVVAARTSVMAAGVDRDLAIRAADAVADGQSPYGRDDLRLGQDDDVHLDAAVVLLAGCRSTQAECKAAAAIGAAAGLLVRVVVPPGCCGSVLRDLGLPEAADVRGRALASHLSDANRIVTMEEQCEREMPASVEVIDVATWLAELVGSLPLRTDGPSVTWHDPPRLARGLGVIDAPRAVLSALGATVVEPEGTGRGTVSAGSGLGFDLLAPDDAAAVAVHRAGQLTATGASIVSTGPEVAMLRAAGLEVTSLLELVAAHLINPEA